MAKTAWRCSQCGTVNEPGARACASCGRWPSLFDLQDSAVDEATAQSELAGQVVEPQVFEPETYETGSFEPEVFGEEVEDAEEAQSEERGRFPRWIVTAIWVLGILIWLVANALSDR